MVIGLSERKKLILKAIVNDYVFTAEPVGSRAIARKYKMGLSAATIRNEMADLEDLGYLEQPHTSAGRVPTHKGYRFFVDYLMQEKALTQKDLILIDGQLREKKLQEIERMIRHVARLLSSVTNYTSLVLGPQIRKSAFNQLKILQLEENQALAVLITDTGFVKNKVIEIPSSLEQEELTRVVNHINKFFKGLTIDQVTRKMMQDLKLELADKLNLVEKTIDLLEDCYGDPESSVTLGGTSNILNQPEFKDMEKIKRLLHLFEEKKMLINILDTPSEGLAVKIGSENTIEEIKECSVITATYKIDGRTIGSIGVLGPTRMEYARVIRIMEHVVLRLNELLRSQ